MQKFIYFKITNKYWKKAFRKWIEEDFFNQFKEFSSKRGRSSRGSQWKGFLGKFNEIINTKDEKSILEEDRI